jgi:hypothetical protein
LETSVIGLKCHIVTLSSGAMMRYPLSLKIRTMSRNDRFYAMLPEVAFHSVTSETDVSFVKLQKLRFKTCVSEVAFENLRLRTCI